MAELVEGAPLLREYGVKSSIEGSNPSLSATSRFIKRSKGSDPFDRCSLSLSETGFQDFQQARGINRFREDRADASGVVLLAEPVTLRLVIAAAAIFSGVGLVLMTRVRDAIAKTRHESGLIPDTGLSEPVQGRAS